MSFFQVDDELPTKEKVQRMLDAEGWVKAAGAFGLWTMAGAHCRKVPLDGVVTVPQLLRLTGASKPVLVGQAALLVRYELWHEPGHDCVKRCAQPPKDGYQFHQWFQFRYGTAVSEKTKREKAAELKTPAIVEAVWARDRGPDGQWRCRYCDKFVERPKGGRGGDRKSERIGWLDHVDPTLAIGATNIVVSCQKCNQEKSQRTPEQAEMVLLPAPGERFGSIDINFPDQSGINRGSLPPAGARSRGGARAQGRAAGVGDGEGVGVGSGEGTGRAGAAPDVPVASPWPSSPPSPRQTPDSVVEGSTCPEHQLPMPCSKCLRRAGGDL